MTSSKKVPLVSARAWQGGGGRVSTSQHLMLFPDPSQASSIWVSPLPQSCLCLVSIKENGVIRERGSATYQGLVRLHSASDMTLMAQRGRAVLVSLKSEVELGWKRAVETETTLSAARRRPRHCPICGTAPSGAGPGIKGHKVTRRYWWLWNQSKFKSCVPAPSYVSLAV